MSSPSASPVATAKTAGPAPAPVSPDPVIEIDDLDFGYGPDLVLRDVHLRLHEREMVSMIGPNGGGKSTLLKLILGLLHPRRGRVRVLGRAPVKARSLVGYVPQYARFDAKFPVNVLDVVLMGSVSPWRPGPYHARERRAAVDALAELGLQELVRRPFADLSGGQRQRVLIARALIAEPSLLLLDEPTANIDFVAQQKLYEHLQELNRERTIVIVSHDLSIVSRVFSSVVCVNREVVTHPVAELTGDAISKLYGENVGLVQHGFHCAEDHHQECCEDHTHPPGDKPGDTADG